MKKILVCLLACLLFLSACSNTAATTSISVGENQILMIGQISELNGNDVTLALAQETGLGANNANETASGESSGDNSGRQQGGKGRTMPSGGAGGDGQAMPSGGMGGGQAMPSGGAGGDGQAMPSGGMGGDGQAMPSGGMGGDGQARPSGGMGGDGQARPSGDFNGQMPNVGSQDGQAANSAQNGTGQSSSGSQIIYTLTGETASVRIPVGTAVTTQAGTVTTFSRLAVGDVVKILMETAGDGSQTAVAVWIVG
ncbi:MAG: hypothetical protein VB070_07650 [Clostridiaceae bacterium]|nr:hypothetical protein [Clostridiaceae bacterium]